MSMDLLAMLHSGEISKDDAERYFDDWRRRFDAGEIAVSWSEWLHLSLYEATAYMHGAGFSELARLRYGGWPTECSICGDHIDYKQGGWWYSGTEAGEVALQHRVCPSRIPQLQRELDKWADPRTKAWWEAYMKGAIPFRGVKMVGIRAALHGWLLSAGIRPGLPVEEQKWLAFALIRETYSEDKIAGILFFQEALFPAGEVDWQEDLPRFAELFMEGHIADWSTCDWLCVRVLGPMIERYGPACAEAIAAWRTSPDLWQRRASGVAFVNLAPKGDANFPGFTDLLLSTCAATVRHPERFSQTGTGWVLREPSRAEPARVAQFIEENIGYFSTESLNYATARLQPEAKAKLKKLHKSAPAR
jgi:3-methyladenine DNA glycosylase AlkD